MLLREVITVHEVSFGLIYDFRNPSRTDWKRCYDATLEQIAWVDSTLPIDGIRVTEHHFYSDGYIPSPLLLLAAIAVKTT
ncbi:MAG: luxA6, partial [Aeromicrobium sp.]|nr:luxA6 [Aeromicrobium sp.]